MRSVMFTGIVTQRATVREARPVLVASGVVRLSVALAKPVAGLSIGESLALDGCCLTVSALDGLVASFDVIPETLRRTTLGGRVPGDRVNVEAALRAGDPLGGHIVQGHVEGMGKVDAVDRLHDDVRMRVTAPKALAGAFVPKGSIAVDGVSLTVGECGTQWFDVYLIPHTLSTTGLGEKKVGDRVNLEPDVLGRYVEHHVRRVLSERAVPEGGARA